MREARELYETALAADPSSLETLSNYAGMLQARRPRPRALIYPSLSISIHLYPSLSISIHLHPSLSSSRTPLLHMFPREPRSKTCAPRPRGALGRGRAADAGAGAGQERDMNQERAAELFARALALAPSSVPVPARPSPRTLSARGRQSD